MKERLLARIMKFFAKRLGLYCESRDCTACPFNVDNDCIFNIDPEFWNYFL